MRRLIMLQGLPGSGKSTWARDYQDRTVGPVVIVTKDDIRAELEKQGWQWSHENEADVIHARDVQIVAAFNAGARVVISADTNFGRKHRERLAELARLFDASFEIKRMVVPIDECMRRDAERDDKKPVGVSVIHGMVRQYGLDKDSQWYGKPLTEVFARYEHAPSLPWVVICDIDGTAAKMTSRSPYDESRVSEDIANLPVKVTVRALADQYNLGIVYMSGRHESSREDTQNWLNTFGFPQGPLYMRSNGDNRHDDIVKGELFDEHIRGRYNVLFILDDRQTVVDFWRSIGLIVFQVAPGKF